MSAFGSKAYIGLASVDVRFTPKSGHWLAHASHGYHRIGIMTAGDVIFSGIFRARTGVIPVCYFLDFYGY